MKVKALLDIVGIGYELKKDEETEMNNKLAKFLIGFGHVEEVRKNNEHTPAENKDENPPVEGKTTENEPKEDKEKGSQQEEK